MSLQEKDKKIGDLRALLTQAKSKIEEYKGQLIQKERDVDEMRRQYDKKIKMLENDSSNIIRQYEERQLRYQKSLEESNQLVDKHQKGMQVASKSYDQLVKKTAAIYTITNKIFYLTPSKDKESSDAVEELCQIQKCKEFMDSMDKFAGIAGLELVTKMISLVVKNNQVSLNRRRDQRIQFVKKETHMLKGIEEGKAKGKTLQNEIDALKKELGDIRDKYERNIENITKNKSKQNEEKTSEEFTKQMVIKLIMGPKDVSKMALGILGKVLKLTEAEAKECEAKIK